MKIQPLFHQAPPACIGENDQRRPQSSFTQDSTLSSFKSYDWAAPLHWVWSCITRFFHFVTCGYCRTPVKEEGPPPQQGMTLKDFVLVFRDHWDDQKTFNAFYVEAWKKLSASHQEALTNACFEILEKRWLARDATHLQYKREEVQEMAKNIMEEPVAHPQLRTLVFYQGKKFEDSTRDLIIETIQAVEKKERGE